MDKMELKKVLDEKGMDWLVAAMVEGSIGYHSPPGARRLIKGALAGETRDYCERCLACFKGDLLQMIESAIEGMKYVEKKNPKSLSEYYILWDGRLARPSRLSIKWIIAA